MSTRSTTHFVYNGEDCAIVYRHSDGYPEGHGKDLTAFFEAVEADTEDTRFTDPNYLAAKLVVWLADRFAVKHVLKDGVYDREPAAKLDFLGVGVMLSDPLDIEYLYEIDCSEIGQDGRPAVRCFEARGDFSSPPTKGDLVSIPA